jgi:tRNA threonylcarbamoyladenosine biosynthesis protein TsaB
MNRVRLAIEASTSFGGVAVGDATALHAEVVLGVQARHSAALLPAVEFALQQAGVRPRELGAIVLGEGPGSFTGVRVAAATALGFARALEIPLLTAGSLAALALASVPHGPAVCALFDARREQVYAACYRFTERAVETLAPPRACGVADAIALARRFDAVCVGEGAHAFGGVIRSAGVRIAGSPHDGPRPAALLRLAGLAGGWASAPARAGWEPLYLRPSAAQRGGPA